MSDDITIRAATKDDRRDFTPLWRAFLQEEHADGGELLPSQHNVMEGLKMFHSYVNGSLYGMIAMAFDGERLVGINPIGEAPDGGFSFESRYGRRVVSWCSYVLPEYRRRGICHKMLHYCESYFRELGFDSCTGFVKPGGASEANAKNYGSDVIAFQFNYSFHRGEKQ